jgi:tRNA(Ile)-lysidine synthase
LADYLVFGWRFGCQNGSKMEELPAVTYIVAVSGGVDSVVLLDMLAKTHSNLIVAHFDHGIRDESADDAKFVGELATKYGLKFETKREELGVGTSEEQARTRRYEFLRAVAKKYKAKIVTAHHGGDVIETIAINLQRGTGWRGLAVLDSSDIVRPLLHVQKSELVNYAKQHKLQWREDSTNASDEYLRNRLRKKLAGINEDIYYQLLALRDHQTHNKRLIDDETSGLAGQSPYGRHFFIAINEKAALELLRTVFVSEAGFGPLAPQLRRALIAIKTADGGTQHDVGGGVKLKFTRTEFVVVAS